MPDLGQARFTFRDAQRMREEQVSYQEWREGAEEQRRREREERLARIRSRTTKSDGRRSNRPGNKGRTRRGRAPGRTEPTGTRPVFTVGADGSITVTTVWTSPVLKGSRWSWREWSTMRPASNITGTSASESAEYLSPEFLAEVRMRAERGHVTYAPATVAEERRVQDAARRARARAWMRDVARWRRAAMHGPEMVKPRKHPDSPSWLAGDIQSTGAPEGRERFARFLQCHGMSAEEFREEHARWEEFLPSMSEGAAPIAPAPTE